MFIMLSGRIVWMLVVITPTPTLNSWSSSALFSALWLSVFGGRAGVLPNRWCVNYTGCRFNTELTTRCLCWHTRLWTRVYRCTSANASIAASAHGHYARRLCHCSSNRSLIPTSRNVLFDVPRRLSGTHFPRLSSKATHCLYPNLGWKHFYFVKSYN